MKNFKNKININRKPISSQEIGDMQDFGSVLKGAQAAALPFYKTWWFMGGAGIAIIVSIVVAALTLNNRMPNTQVAATPAPVSPIIKTTTTKKAFIQPAFKGFDVDFTRFWVKSGNAKTYTIPSGTEINIAPCHFMDAEGNTVEGDVEIRYREMNDPVDFAVSGIPMTYDSAGQKYTFESAGMFELQGWQNGKQVFINPNCPITINQKTVSTNGKFNMYYLDTAKRNWEYIGKPNWVEEPTTTSIEKDFLVNNSSKSELIPYTFSYPVDANDSLNKALENIQTDILVLNSKAPKAPRKMEDSKQNFTIEFNAEQFPEFEPFTNTIFGVVDEKNFTPALYKYRWSIAKIEYTNQLTLKEGQDSLPNSFTISLANSTYIGDKIVGDAETLGDGVLDNFPWYIKVWRGIRKLFGKKYAPQSTNNGQNEPQSTFANNRTVEKQAGRTFTLIPVDSSQYFYQRSDYRSPVSFKVLPVLSEEQYAVAMADFEEKMKEHKKLLQQKKEKEEEIRKAIKERNRLFRENWQKRAQLQQQEKYRKLKEQGIDSAYITETNNKARSSNAEIRNAFAASKFGIYNCDFPFRYSNAVTSVVNFKKEDGKAQYVGNGFIIVKNKNALMNVYYNNCCDVRINHIQRHKNIFFTVLPDDRIAYYSSDNFKQLPTNTPTDMVLQISDKKMESVNEIKAYLGVTKNIGLQ